MQVCLSVLLHKQSLHMLRLNLSLTVNCLYSSLLQITLNSFRSQTIICGLQTVTLYVSWGPLSPHYSYSIGRADCDWLYSLQCCSLQLPGTHHIKDTHRACVRLLPVRGEFIVLLSAPVDMNVKL